MTDHEVLERFRHEWEVLQHIHTEYERAWRNRQVALIAQYKQRGLSNVVIGGAIGVWGRTVWAMLKEAQVAIPKEVKNIPVNQKAVLANFCQDWQALKASKDSQDIDYDVNQGELFQRYLDRGLTQRQMAEEVKISQSHINGLLRYHQFLIAAAIKNLMPVGIKISERRFREYWSQIADGGVTGTLRGEKNKAKLVAYEQEVFAAIAAMITEGRQPTLRVKPDKPATVDGVLKAGGGSEARTFRVLKKEVIRTFNAPGGLKDTCLRLEKLLHADRATYTPDLMAETAFVLRREMAKITKLLGVSDLAWGPLPSTPVMSITRKESGRVAQV